MTNATHKPEPWAICTCPFGQYASGYVAAGTRIIMRGGSGTREKANLIVAAQDLLAALVELDAWALNESGAEYPAGTFEIVRAAIAKATGEA
jgi:hypothetical protein